MVPKVEFPFVTPFTVQVTAVLPEPVTEAVSAKVLFIGMVYVEPLGLIIATTTPLTMVTLTEADLVLSAALVAVTLKVACDGMADGAS
jgi:hypothetical protein